MSIFLEKVSLALDAFHTEYITQAIELLKEAFNPKNLPEELTADNFNAFFDALEVVEAIIEQLPQIKKTTFVVNTLGNLRDAMEQLLEGETDYLDWYLLKEFYRLLNALKQGIDLLEKRQINLGETDNTTLLLAIEEDEKHQLSANILGQLADSDALSPITPQELAQIKEKFDKNTQNPNEANPTELRELAKKLCISGQYELSIAYFEQIIRIFASEKANSLNMIGANHFYMKNYETAISFYVQAMQAGTNKDTIEFNIWEACKQLIDQAMQEEEKEKWKKYFKSVFPESKLLF